MEDQYLIAGTLSFYPLPATMDNDNDTVTISVTQDLSQLFTTYENGGFYFRPQSLNVGQYQIFITLTDNQTVPQSQTYFLNVTVVNPPSNTTASNSNSSNSGYELFLKEFKAYITKIDMTG